MDDGRWTLSCLRHDIDHINFSTNDRDIILPFVPILAQEAFDNAYILAIVHRDDVVLVRLLAHKGGIELIYVVAL